MSGWPKYPYSECSDCFYFGSEDDGDEIVNHPNESCDNQVYCPVKSKEDVGKKVEAG